MNLNVTGFTSIGEFQFYVVYDPAVLTPLTEYKLIQGVWTYVPLITNFNSGGLNAGTSGGNTVTMAWTSPSPVTFSNGTLLTLNFKYHGLTSALSFNAPYCEVSKLVGVIPTTLTGTLTNGSISPYLSNTEQAHIGNVFATTGSAAVVPLWYTGSAGTNVDSITQKIAYDATKLTFTSVIGAGLLNTNITASATSGIVTLHWAKTSGALLNTPGSMFYLNFTYTGSVTTPVTFSTGNIIQLATSYANLAVTYNNGSVLHAGTPSAFASLPVLNTAVQGQTIDVPLTFTGMPAGITAFTLNLSYDYPRMAFAGIFSAPAGVTSNNSGNTILINYSGTAISNGQFLLLRFTYNGVGTANITFGTPCQFTNSAPVQVGYTNGSVTPAHVNGQDATIGYVTVASGNPALVPVTFTGLPPVGRVTMNISFDATKLTYVSTPTNPNGATVTLNGNMLNIVWTSVTGTDINNDPFVVLRFNYVAGSGNNCAGAMTFNDGSVVKTTAGTVVPANWNNGGVNVKFKISGTLKYQSAPDPQIPLEGFTVVLYSGTDTVARTTTEVGTGYFELYAPNGTDTLTAIAPTGLSHYIEQDDALAIYFQAFGVPGYIPVPYPYPLNYTAGDLNQSGDMDISDFEDAWYYYVDYTILPDYTAPHWIFETPAINISCTDATNQDFLGLNSGDVLGRNPDPNH
ncbi:MAG: cohesin domain-containing protein [Bacteroidota bacterium]